MVIMYGYGVEFRIEGNAGNRVCRNCGHEASHSLCRKMFKFTLFRIPIFRHQIKMGAMCESCGFITPMDRQEYMARKL